MPGLILYLLLKAFSFYFYMKLCLEVCLVFVSLNQAYPKPWYADDPWVILIVILVLVSFGRFLFDPEDSSD